MNEILNQRSLSLNKKFSIPTDLRLKYFDPDSEILVDAFLMFYTARDNHMLKDFVPFFRKGSKIIFPFVWYLVEFSCMKQKSPTCFDYLGEFLGNS